MDRSFWMAKTLGFGMAGEFQGVGVFEELEYLKCTQMTPISVMRYLQYTGIVKFPLPTEAFLKGVVMLGYTQKSSDLKMLKLGMLEFNMQLRSLTYRDLGWFVLLPKLAFLRDLCKDFPGCPGSFFDLRNLWTVEKLGYNVTSSFT